MITMTEPDPSPATVRRTTGPIVVVGVVVTVAAALALGVLWIREGAIKYRAGFGAADIHLVADGAGQNSRVPGFFQEFCAHVLGPNAGLFGFAMPALEVALGVGFIVSAAAVVFTDIRWATTLMRLVAGGSVFTLMTYWLSDQLIWEYPIMVLLSALVLTTVTPRRR